MQTLTLLFVAVLMASEKSASWQTNDCGRQVVYENRNQVDPTAISLQDVSGIAMDKDGVVVSGVCVAVFTEKDHLLASTIATDQGGKFRVDKLPKGDYRLVVKYAGFCTANIPIKFNPQASQKTKQSKQLVVQLRLSGYDECSFAEYKSFSRK